MLSLAALNDEHVMFTFKKRIKRGASFILLYCDRLLKKYSLSLKEFDCFVVGAGPGSFTGLRISFSIVKGWSCALGVPVLSVGSFFSIAEKVKHISSRIVVLSDARRGLVYASPFNVKGDTVLKGKKERLVSLEDLIFAYPRHLFVTYDALLREKAQRLNPNVWFYSKDVWPEAFFLVKRAYDYCKKEGRIPSAKLEPLYIYPKTCQVKNV